MTLTQHFRTAPSRILSAFSFAACARALKPRASGYAASELSDEILCDIGMSRCLLLTGFGPEGLAD